MEHLKTHPQFKEKYDPQYYKTVVYPWLHTLHIYQHLEVVPEITEEPTRQYYGEVIAPWIKTLSELLTPNHPVSTYKAK